MEDLPLPQRVAAALWAEAEPRLAGRPRPPRPLLLVMVGVPLSGKSTLARALAEQAGAATLRVENDAVRPHVAAALGQPAVTYEGPENLLTYQTAWTLLERALWAGMNAIHDGTNLNEGARRGAYAAAQAAGAEVVVLFVLTDPGEVARRAATHPPERQAAHAKLGRKRPNPAACSLPHLVLDGARPVAELLEALRADFRFGPFFNSP